MNNEMEERFDRDPLAMRLSEMTFPAPPDRLVPDTLAVARSGRPPRRRELLRPAAVVAAVLVAAVAVTALAWAPARALVSDGLGRLGALNGAAPGHQGTLAEATGGGYTVRVTGAYDDGTTVAISFAVSRSSDPDTPLEDVWPYPHPIVTDSAGNQLRSTFTPVKEALTMFTVGYDRPLGGPAAGTPLAIDVTNLDHKGQITGGQWRMPLTIPPTHSVRSLPAPETGRLGGATISFQAVRANDAYLFTQFTIDGLVSPENRTPQEGKGHGVQIQLFGPNGEKLTILNGRVSNFSLDEPQVNTWRWQLADEPGAYRLVLTGDNGEQLVRTIDIPNGRGATVPKILQR